MAVLERKSDTIPMKVAAVRIEEPEHWRVALAARLAAVASDALADAIKRMSSPRRRAAWAYTMLPRCGSRKKAPLR